MVSEHTNQWINLYVYNIYYTLSVFIIVSGSVCVPFSVFSMSSVSSKRSLFTVTGVSGTAGFLLRRAGAL